MIIKRHLQLMLASRCADEDDTEKEAWPLLGATAAGTAVLFFRRLESIF